MKKFFSLVLALVMALSLTTVAWGAVAATDVAKIGDTGYATLAEATAAAANADDKIVTLLSDTITGEITTTNRGDTAYPDPYAAYQIKTALMWTTGGTMTGCTINATRPADGGAHAALTVANIDSMAGGEAKPVTISNTNVTTAYINSAFYLNAVNAPITLNNVIVTGDRGGIYAEYAGDTVTLNNVTVDAKGNYAGTNVIETAVRAASGANVVINGGSYKGEYAAGVMNSGGTLTINSGTFDGKLFVDAGVNGAVSKLVINGGTFTDPDAVKYLADGLTLTDDGVVVSEGGTVLTATTYDMVTTDAAQVKTVGVTANVFAAKAPKDTDKDGLLDQPGNVKYVEFSNMPSAVFVQVNTVGEADYAVYQTGTTTLFGYFKAVVSPYYEGNGVAFYNFGEKCGQYDDEPVADTKYYTFQGVLYKTVKVSPINLMVGNTLTPVDLMDDTNWVQHVPAYTYDKDYKVVGVKCAECGTEAVIYANWASVPKADKQAGNAYRVNDNDYYCWLAGPGAVVDTDTKVESAETFDAGIAMYVGMSVMAATGSAVVIGKKRG